MSTDCVVELVVTGQVGLNLQATKNGTGAFVDSFYRGVDADSGVEFMLPAESTLGATLLGTIISSVNGQDVTTFPALDICKIISKAERPLKLEFLRHNQDFEEPVAHLTTFALPWLLEHLLALDGVKSPKSNAVSTSLLRAKLLCYIDCKRVSCSIELLKIGQQKKLICFLESLLSPLPELSSLLCISDCVQNLIEITSLLETDLMRDFYPSFAEGIAIRRMRGYIFRSLVHRRLALVDILANKATLFHLFMFQSRSHRRHILLLCYVQLRKIDLQSNLLDLLVHCLAVLDLCKEPYLQALRDRLDSLIDDLCLPVIAAPFTSVDDRRQKRRAAPESLNLPEYRQIAIDFLSEIVECLAWEYVVAIFPSFEVSKDYAFLLSNLTSNIPAESKSTNMKEGSTNELLRNRKLPNSLTVHRREIKAVSGNLDAASPMNITMFDTYTDDANTRNSGGKLVAEEVTEDGCTSGRVQVKGITRSFDLSYGDHHSDTDDTLRALSTFLVPTGKAAIIFKSAHGHLTDGQQPPTPKLFSMVITTRNQTQIYACSLVLYRPVRLIKSVKITKNNKILETAELNTKTEVGEKRLGVLNKSSTELPTIFSGILEFSNAIKDLDEIGESNVDILLGEKSVSLAMTPEHEDASLSIPISETTKQDSISTEHQLLSPISPPGQIRVSALTDETPAVCVLASSVSTEYSVTSTDSYIDNIGAELNNCKIQAQRSYPSFSDDDSAGIVSVLSDLPNIPVVDPICIEPCQRFSSGSGAQKQGSFAEFLSVTATVTASVASAIALQAGSLPTTTFSWKTTNSNSTSKGTDAKGFYENLNFSRFKAMNFANATNFIQSDVVNGSGVKRKYDGIGATEPLFEYNIAPVFNAGSVRQSISPASLTSSHSDSSILSPTSSKEVEQPKPFLFSPEKLSLSSYPRFGHAKSPKKSSSFPHASSRSPRYTTARSQNRRARLAQATSANPSSVNSLRRSSLTTEASMSTLSSPSTSSGSAFLADVSKLSLTGHETTGASETTVDRAYTSTTETDKGTITSQEEIQGVAYVAHGICLHTKDPLVEKLREAAVAVATDFEQKSLVDINCCNGSLPFPQAISELPQSVLDGIMKSLGTNIDIKDKDYNSSIILDALSPKNLVTVLIAFLLEYRIVVVSSRSLSAATHLGEWLKETIYPLKYSHVYSPLVPLSIGLQLIHCPAPFFIGMKRSSMIDEVVELEDERDREKNKGRWNKSVGVKDAGCGLLVVDMDRDECSMPQDLIVPVRSARLLIRALELLLHPQLSDCDEVKSNVTTESLSPSALAKRVMYFCRKFVSSTLQGSDLCCLHVEDGDEKIVLFDEVLFLQQHNARLSLRPTAVAKLRYQKDQSALLNTDINKIGKIEVDEFPLISTTASGGKDFEKLLKSLLRTQSFSLYLTS